MKDINISLVFRIDHLHLSIHPSNNAKAKPCIEACGVLKRILKYFYEKLFNHS